MKWETLKKNIATQVHYQITTGWSFWCQIAWVALNEKILWRDAVDRCANAAYDRIMNWDVRCVGRLRELFPEAFPKSLRNGNLMIYMADNENCDWMVEKVI